MENIVLENFEPLRHNDHDSLNSHTHARTPARRRASHTEQKTLINITSRRRNETLSY